MRKSDKLKSIARANVIAEERFSKAKRITEREEVEVGRDAQGRTVYKDDEHNYYIYKNGIAVDVDYRGNNSSDTPQPSRVAPVPPATPDVNKVKGETDLITKALIDNKFFDGTDRLEPGTMLDSFSHGKLQHNQDIRGFISKFAEANNISSNVKDVYWNKFW
jgi:hypothetical protein